MRKYARFGRKLRKLTRQAKICTPPRGDAYIVSADMSADMSGHVWTCLDMSGHGGHRCLDEVLVHVALLHQPGADCENMRSAKIILSPYG